MKQKSLKVWIITAIIILVASSFFVFLVLEKKEEKEEMDIDVLDGYNIDSEHGCFFILYAGKGVQMNIDKYSFWVGEKGESSKKLDIDFRRYAQDTNQTPLDGDRNSSYLYSGDREVGGIWGLGQAIAFDMPRRNLGIEIEDGKIYMICIKNKNRDVIWHGEFIYHLE